MKILNTIKRIASTFTSPVCIGCDRLLPVDNDGPLCNSCCDVFYHPHDAGCQICGHPQKFDGTCPSCILLGDVWYRNLSFVHYYTGFFKKMLLQWKKEHHFALTDFYAKLLINRNLVCKDIPVMAVPDMPLISFRRQGSNLNALLGRLKAYGIPVLQPQYKRRVTLFHSQKKLGVRKRIEEIGKHYSLPLPVQAASNERVILLDDVYTTGATINQGAKLLRSVGFSEIRAVTLFRARLERSG